MFGDEPLAMKSRRHVFKCMDKVNYFLNSLWLRKSDWVFLEEVKLLS
jgi:hypothetical protein